MSSMPRQPSEALRPSSPCMTRPQTRAIQSSANPSLQPEQLVHIYRWMCTSRRIDDLEIGLKRQNHIHFQISGAGHEISLVAAAMHLRPGHDWFFPYYRDRALVLALGVTPLELLLQAVGAASDPASGGRQMPCHWSDRDRHIVSEASTTGTQYLSAIGCAEAGRFWLGTRQASAHSKAQDEVVYCSSGEGATSQGVFFEALNSACLAQLPVLFHIEDNGWAISTPSEQQTAGGSISELVKNYPTLLVLQFDGCDPEESFAAWDEGVTYARKRRGPVLLHAKVVRPYSHSLSDDERLYRTDSDLAHQTSRDPLPKLRQRLMDSPDVGPKRVTQLEAEIDRAIEQARNDALAAAPPAPASATDFVYSPDVDPCGADFVSPHEPGPGERTMVDCINHCLREEMHQDERIVVFGEDVADVSCDSKLDRLRGKGGVFKVTHNLQRLFGSRRVFNTPLAEANIVGRAFGMALRGLKPVVEIQFFDYIWPAMMHLRSEVALLRWRSNNAWSCPMVIRAAYGGYLRGGSIFHSQTGESIFAHIPGLRVVLPSCAADAAGLLRTAMRCEDPVLFLEHKHLYRQTFNRCEEPSPAHTVPFGKAISRTMGDDITLVTYGALVKRSVDAAQRLKEQGVGVEVIDLRTLSPYDWDSIAASIKRTSRVLIVHEENKSWGFGAEIAARVAEEMFDCLDAPVRRLASLDTFVGYHPGLEEHILPQTDDVVEALVKLAAY